MDKGFLSDLLKLEKPVAKRVTEVFDEFGTATHTGLHLEKINNARNPRFRSIRIDQFWRGVVLAPQAGDVYTLLKVLPHNDAYAWAQRSNISINHATGGIEIRDEAGLEDALPDLAVAAQGAPTLLLESVRDSDMHKLGIDDSTLEFARALTSTAQLDAAKALLPETQWDVLCGLAAGFSPDEVWADLGAAILDEPVDTSDFDAAVLRSRNRVLLVDGPEELMKAYEYPFATWRVYLHPTQRAIAEATYSGPARVTGGPGTGKTVVALHRAQNLVNRGEGKVLVTTFTSTLSDSLQWGLDVLNGGTNTDVEVCHVDKLAHRVFRQKFGAPKMLSSVEEKAIWQKIVQQLGVSFSDAFLAEEWRQVVLARRISGADDYRATKRTGRGRPLGQNQRSQVWQAIADFEDTIGKRNCWTHETVRREATAVLEGDTNKPYRHIIIDEAQDLSPDQWRLLRAAVPKLSDDIFIAGDTHQRIYDHRVSFREVGINVAGRSSKLNLNYRTTAEILGWSLGLMRGAAIDDMDGGLDSIAGCRSFVHGMTPRTVGLPNAEDEARFVTAYIKGWLDKGITPSEIGIATRTKWGGSKIEGQLKAHSIPTIELSNSTAGDVDAISIGTMHRMKGLEFRCVVVAGVNATQLPLPNAVTPIDEDELTHEHGIERERSLLFVACTRAREELLVTWNGDPSPFLHAINLDAKP